MVVCSEVRKLQATGGRGVAASRKGGDVEEREVGRDFVSVNGATRMALNRREQRAARQPGAAGAAFVAGKAGPLPSDRRSCLLLWYRREPKSDLL